MWEDPEEETRSRRRLGFYFVLVVNNNVIKLSITSELWCFREKS